MGAEPAADTDIETCTKSGLEMKCLLCTGTTRCTARMSNGMPKMADTILKHMQMHWMTRAAIVSERMDRTGTHKRVTMADHHLWIGGSGHGDKCAGGQRMGGAVCPRF